MNPIALDAYNYRQPWDGAGSSSWHDWACWVPGRHEPDPVATTESPSGQDPGRLVTT